MKNCLTFLLLITSIIVFYACSNKGERPAGEKSYFDLSGFMQNEIQLLTEGNPNIIKSVKVNGRTEQDKIKIDDWKRELSAFTQADINKPALVGHYEIDSHIVDGKLTLLSYVAQKKDLKTRKLILHFDQTGKPDKIEITLAKKNVLFQYDQDLAYMPNKGYSISGKQIIKFMGENRFSVDTEFRF